MIEYCVVVSFGVLTLTTGPMRDLIFQLGTTIRNNFQGYSYAVSLSDTPDHTNSADLEALLIAQGVPDDQAAYLAQNPFDLMQYIDDYASLGIPDFQDGLDEIDDALGLSPSDFLEGLSPF
jgi:hypothetical protein